MLIRIFKSTQPAALFAILPVLAIALWLSGIIYPEVVHGKHAMPLFEAVANLLNPFPRLSVFIALIITYFQGLLINGIVNKNEMLPHRSNLVALIYVLLMSSFDSFLTLHPVLFANLFLLLALNKIGSIYKTAVVFSEVFDAGALIAIASLFYFPAILLFFFVWASLLIIRPFVWREYFIAAIGVLLPYVFITVYYYYFDMLDYLWYDKIFFPISERNLSTSTLDLSDYLFVAFLSLLLILSLSRVLSTINKTVIRTQNLLWSLVAFLLFSVIAMIIAGNNSNYVYGFMAIPVSIFFANFFYTIKKNLVSEALFLFLLGIIIFHHISG